MGHYLEVEDMRTSFISGGREVKAVNGVSFYADLGETIGVVGESGSGKSVTMLSILKLVSEPGVIKGGTVRIGGRDVSSCPPNSPEMRAVRGGEISMIFQEPMTSLNPVMTVGYQISESICLHLKTGKAEARKRAVALIKDVGIPDAEERYNYYPHQFSGGMRQRIMIAMALASDPKIIIADEATTALDVTTQAQILELLQSIVKRLNKSLIIITHNLGVVARYAERIYVMYGGSVVETGTVNDIFYHPTHPYTSALLNAVPRLDSDRDRPLVPIEGNPVDLSAQREGCAFYERCAFCTEACLHSAPRMREVSPGHSAACAVPFDELRRGYEERARLSAGRTPRKQVTDEVIVRTEGLCKFFPITSGVAKRVVGQVKAVDHVDLSVHRGETVGVVGESGCGKTTLARTILRLYEPSEGSISFCGRDISHLKERDIRAFRKEMPMVFQDPFSSLNPRFSAEKIIGEPLIIHGLVHSRREYDRRVSELMEMVGLNPEHRDRMPHEFSGGQRQRVGIARALASNPTFIVCDEPISALDVSIQAQIINLLEKIQAEMQLTYLFIAHDLSVVKHISDRIVVMYLGKVVETAPCDELYRQPLHPYTQALLSAIPIPDPELEKTRSRIVLPGEIPSQKKRPSGCVFSDRCIHADEGCKLCDPALAPCGANHEVACLKVTGAGK